MKCDNCFCIYWESNNCTLEEISLNISGSCESCIYIMPSELILKKERDKILINLEQTANQL